MDEIFGPSGSLAAVLPTFEPRAEQAELAAAVAEALERGEHLLAEAGTGTGKSLAYLVPALACGERVVVATATRALQEQLVRNDLPAAAAALGREPSYALLKGRENYLCRRSLDGLALLGGSLFHSAEDASGYEALHGWIETTETGDRAELPFEPGPGLWAELAVGGERCLGRRCPARSVCFSEAARGRAAAAEVVVTNHALYFADVALRARAGGREPALLPEHGVVVLDEAHRLEDAAAAWLGDRVSLAGLRRLARDVERAARERGASPPARALAELDRLARDVIGRLAPRAGRRRLTARQVEPALEASFELAAALGRLSEALAGSGEAGDALARRALAAAEALEACLELDGDRVSWAEPGAIGWAPIDVSNVLRDELWGGEATAVLVSATLGTAGARESSFAFLQRRLGLDRALAAAVASPFDYGEQALLYVPDGLPEPRAPGYAERIAEEAVALCRLSSGRALVLTSSYRALEHLAPRLAAGLPFPVLRQGEAPRERLLERFRAEVDSVLVATQTFWQGVDVPGEALSLVVIDKLPFAPPDDPLHQARCERIVAAGGDWFADYALPNAVLQLRQGFGRLIRTREDRGVVAILDARLRTRPYGRLFLEALPACPLVSDREAVASFFGVPVAGG